MILVYMLES